MDRGASAAARVTSATGPRLALAAAIVTGAVLRIASLMLGSSVSLNGDEAVTGLMVKRIVSGQQNYVYFAGQKYNGSLEQYLQAAMYAIFPVPQTPLTLRLVEVAIAVLVILATYGLARLVLESRWTAVVAASVFAIGPYWNIYMGTRSQGGYPSSQLFATLGAVCALRALGYRPGRVRVPLPRSVVTLWCAGFGACWGLVGWVGLSGLEILLPAAIWLLPTLFRSVRTLGGAVAGGVLGLGVVECWIVATGQFPSISSSMQPNTAFLHRLFLLFDQVAGEFFGVGGEADHPGLQVWAQHAIVLGLIAVWVIAVGRRRRGLLDILTLRDGNRQPIDLVIFAFPVAAILYSISPYTWYSGEPRYIFVLYPISSIALVAAAAEGFKLARRWFGHVEWTRIVVGVTLAAIALGTVATVVQEVHYLADGSKGKTTDDNLRAADTYLAGHDERYAYAEYWTALPAQYFAGNDGVEISPWDRLSMAKSAAAASAVAHSRNFVYVGSLRIARDSRSILAEAFARYHVSYREVVIGTVTIYYDLKPLLRPQQMHLPG